MPDSVMGCASGVVFWVRGMVNWRRHLQGTSQFCRTRQQRRLGERTGAYPIHAGLLNFSVSYHRWITEHGRTMD